MFDKLLKSVFKNRNEMMDGSFSKNFIDYCQSKLQEEKDAEAEIAKHVSAGEITLEDARELLKKIPPLMIRFHFPTKEVRWRVLEVGTDQVKAINLSTKQIEFINLIQIVSWRDVSESPQDENQ
jgi:hypothetical protein